MAFFDYAFERAGPGNLLANTPSRGCRFPRRSSGSRSATEQCDRGPCPGSAAGRKSEKRKAREDLGSLARLSSRCGAGSGLQRTLYTAAIGNTGTYGYWGPRATRGFYYGWVRRRSASGPARRRSAAAVAARRPAPRPRGPFGRPRGGAPRRRAGLATQRLHT
jgi:hypothetical protein